MQNRRKGKPLGFCLFLFLSFCFSVLAQENEKISFESSIAQAKAQELIYDRKNETLTMRGEVEISYPPWLITAPEILVDLKTKIITANQGVKIIRKEKAEEREVLLAETAEINLDNSTGFMAQGKLILPTTQGEIKITGQKFERVSENLYLIEAGSFTSCQCPEDKKPDWEVYSEKIQADTQGTAKMHSARIRLRGKTIFYLPYFELPISEQRKSGFLPPEFGYSSRSGAQLTLPYYQTLGPSADLTLYPSWIEYRGFQLGEEFRYNLFPISKAEQRFFIIDDQKEDDKRWSGYYYGESSWKDGELKADIRLVSDNEYVLDFKQNFYESWQGELESRIILTQTFPHSSLSGEFSFIDDLAGYDLKFVDGLRPDQDESVIQRVPELHYQVFNQSIKNSLGFDINAGFTNYWRERENLGRGMELSLSPRFTFSPSEKWNLGPAYRFFNYAGYQLSFYQPDSSADFPGADDSSFSARPFLGGNFGLALEKIYARDEARKYRHLILPELKFQYLGEAEKPKDSFFEGLVDPEEKGLVGIQFNSLLFQKPITQNQSPAKLLSQFELRQFYDWTTEEFYDLELKGFLEFEKFGLELSGFYNLENQELHRAHSLFWLESQRKDRIWLGYLYSEGEIKSSWFSYLQEDAENLSAGFKKHLASSFELQYQLNYSLYYDSLVSQTLLAKYLAPQKCWELEVLLGQRINPTEPDKEPELLFSIYFQLIASADISPTLGWSGSEAKFNFP